MYAPRTNSTPELPGSEPEEVVIAVMGATGSGKSTFINLVSGSHLAVGDGLESCTDKVEVADVFEMFGKPITLIDTPGFGSDDTMKSDTDILSMIVMYLSSAYEDGFKLSGIIWVHRISDFRVGGISRQNFTIFRNLCGNQTLSDVAIVTNMWSRVTPPRGAVRERELRTDDKLFAPVLQEGAKMLRHDGTVKSARAVLEHLMSNTARALRTQADPCERPPPATPRHGLDQPSRQGDARPKSTVPPTQSVQRGNPSQQTRGLDHEDDRSESQDRTGRARGRAWDMSGPRRSMDDGQGITGPRYGSVFYPIPPAVDHPAARSVYPLPHDEDSQQSRRRDDEDDDNENTASPTQSVVDDIPQGIFDSDVPPAVGLPAASSSYPLPHRRDRMRDDLRSRAVRLKLKNAAAFPEGTAPKRQMPAGLRLLFGLSSGSTSSGVVSPSSPNAHQSALSHQRVWDHMVTMDESRGSAGVLFANRHTDGRVFTLTPPASVDSRSLCSLQTMFKGTGAIPDEDADMLCSSLGVDGLVEKLNDIFGTTYGPDRTANHRTWLDARMKQSSSMDVGLAYGLIRRMWFGNINDQIARARATGDRRRKAVGADVITDPRIPPRRVWDLYSNRVLPFDALLAADVPRNMWAVSHSWVPGSQLRHVWTPINGNEWPAPIPSDVDLSQVRIELLNLGAEYVWLDALCLRQEIPPASLSLPDSPHRDEQEWRDATERDRREEWRLDVPTIGYVYRCKPSQVVVTYFNGLGRPFRESLEGEDSAHHWINRVWTMQEATPNWLLGGLSPQPFDEREPGVSDTIQVLHRRISDLLAVLSHGQTPPDLFALVGFLRLRHARHDNDYVSSLGYFLQCPVIPIYDETIPVEIAWERLVCQLDAKTMTDLLFQFPVAGANPKARWRPSWEQLRHDPLTPRSTSSVTYLHQDLVHYDPKSREYSNVAYVVEGCFLLLAGTDGLQLQVPIAPGFTCVAISSTSPSLGESLVGTQCTVAATADLRYWLCGKTVCETKDSITLEKYGTFTIDSDEDIDELYRMNLGYADQRVIYA